jgi:hypothetical protein
MGTILLTDDRELLRHGGFDRPFTMFVATTHGGIPVLGMSLQSSTTALVPEVLSDAEDSKEQSEAAALMILLKLKLFMVGPVCRPVGEDCFDGALTKYHLLQHFFAGGPNQFAFHSGRSRSLLLVAIPKPLLDTFATRGRLGRTGHSQMRHVIARSDRGFRLELLQLLLQRLNFPQFLFLYLTGLLLGHHGFSRGDFRLDFGAHCTARPRSFFFHIFRVIIPGIIGTFIGYSRG